MLRVVITLIFLLSCASDALLAQGKEYNGPDDPAGDVAAERDGYMNGNRVYLYYQNTTELADWPRVDASLWPNTYEGTRTLDGIGLLVGARVYIENDSIPVDNFHDINMKSNLDTLYYLQTSYRQQMDTDPTGTIEWGFYPVFGYFNETSEHPAMSNRPDSWPPAGWPKSGNILDWAGEWDGRFGRGVRSADLETYFVVNDAHDQEYLGFEDRVRYYPRPGKFIGDKRPQVSIQKGKPWGGIGVRVEQRGFQWNNPQARDAIFWEYSIANISEYDLPEVAFGYWVDTWIGGEGASDDVGYFDTLIDMAYSWDTDGVGFGGRVPGTLGFAYLESPGMAFDGKDNDDDGLTDENREEPAQNYIGATDGITDLAKFLKFYRLKEEDLQPHWDADEDQDWQDGIDVNGNNAYAVQAADGSWYMEAGENPGDDVGLDGVAPGELNYYGPDEGEGNHRPDYVQGIGCEPNFNALDVSETDMVGLTSFQLFNIPNENSSYRWFKGDKSMWELIGTEGLVEWSGNQSNLIMTFASGPFPLYKGRVEHISMSELHSYDPLAGLNSSAHSAPALFEQKRIVQVIYEKDYRFAQPPKMPTLSATAGDGKVILTWDDVADKRTRDPFVGNINDFEGYKLFRATDKKFSDPQLVTDGYGTASFLKPIFQCDKIDGISGFAEFGHVRGALYNLGAETGLVHHYVDEEVQNGRTYYYALVAYDFGIESLRISPSENRIVIELNEDEDIRFVGQNVQVVTPHQKAAGYIPPSIEVIDDAINIGTGEIIPDILSEKVLKSNHTYKIKFSIDELVSVSNYAYGKLYTTSGFSVFDVTGGNHLVYQESVDSQPGLNIIYNDTLNYAYVNPQREISTDVFDGLRLRMNQNLITAQYDIQNSDWIQGSSDINITPTAKESYYFPWEYNIVFTSNPNEYTGRVSNTRSIRNEFGLSRLRNLLTQQDFSFYVVNKSFVDSTGAYEKLDLVAEDVNANGQFDILEDRVFVGPVKTTGQWAGTAFIIDFQQLTDNAQLPKNGDVYQVTFNRPFFITDSLVFKINPEQPVDKTQIDENLEKIRVVPNPYIATNMMEPAVSNVYLNQRRRLMFTHIPAQCTIKIFTVSGVLIRKIEVDNAPDNGIVHWDLRSKEGLDVAAGMYFYHVKVTETGGEKLGKFAVIK